MSASNAARHKEFLYSTIFPFVLAHLACVAVIWSGITWQAAALGFALYWLRMFGISAGYHRYFSHRAYSTSRIFQFILACLAQSTAQKSVLWWAEKHRAHHLYSDLPQDVHSPRQRGFFYSHVGWIFARQHDDADLGKIKDFARYPELMWLHRLESLPAVLLAGLCFLIAGWPGLVVGFFCSTVFVYHTTFCINSLAHVCGTKRYLTGDDSRNNWMLAILTMGEGWHNNHHAYQSSVRQGFRWWEVDVTFYILKLLSWLGIVWNLKSPPQEILRNEQRLGARVINRAATELAAQFNAQMIAFAISATLQGPELSQLREALQRAQDRAADVLSGLHLPALPHLPSREEFLAAAKSRFVKTISLDEIVDRAYELLLTSIGSHLALPEQRS